MSPAIAVFLFSLFILHTGVTSDDHPLDVKERRALLDFIQNVKHDPSKLSWKESEPACSWKGVTCDPDNTTVIYLRLPAKSLVGQIPPNTIGKLTNLRVLSLRINSLTGTIPSDFSNLTSLTILSLSNNSFSGQLPCILAKRLTIFNVSINKLNTSIPPSFSRFPKSSFSVNIYVCGANFTIKCNASYPDPPCYQQKVKDKKVGEIVGISVGSGLVLWILLCCVRKKLYQVPKQPPKPPLKAANKLALFGCSFDLEELLRASAEVLGEGSVGTSYKQVVEGRKKTVVVKRLKDVVVTEEEFKKTMEVLGRMKNKNVASLRGYYYSKDEKFLVYDYMHAGSLSFHLHGSIGSRQTHLDWDHRMRIALSAARGLAYLHVAKVVHGNIKSSNILLGQETNNEASVSDYGLNKLFGEPSSLNHRLTGYQAPELLNTHEVTFESDVYSFGVLLVELLTGKTPKQASLSTKGGHFSKLVESVVSEEPKTEIFDEDIRKEHKIEEMLRIAKNCVSIVPEQRPIMAYVVNMMDDMWLRPSSDDHSTGYDDTPSTDIRDTPSSIVTP